MESQGISIGIDYSQLAEGNRISAISVGSNKVQIKNNGIISSHLVFAIVIRPNNAQFAIVNDGRSNVCISIAPRNIYKGQSFVVCKIHNKACGALVILDCDRYADGGAACDCFFTDIPTNRTRSQC